MINDCVTTNQINLDEENKFLGKQTIKTKEKNRQAEQASNK